MNQNNHSKNESEGNSRLCLGLLLPVLRMGTDHGHLIMSIREHEARSTELSGSICPDGAGGSICCLTATGRPCPLGPLENPTRLGGHVYLNESSYVIPGKDNTGKKCPSHLFSPGRISWQVSSRVGGGAVGRPRCSRSHGDTCSLLWQVSAPSARAHFLL